MQVDNNKDNTSSTYMQNKSSFLQTLFSISAHTLSFEIEKKNQSFITNFAKFLYFFFFIRFTEKVTIQEQVG